MKRELFRRPNRMVHKFSGLENDDPLASRETFDPGFPTEPQQSSRPLSVQKDGLHEYREPRSPITKPTGADASINGPVPDYAGAMGASVPASTKNRRSQK